MRCFSSTSANYLGVDALHGAMPAVGRLGVRRALLVTDRASVRAGLSEKVGWALRGHSIDSVLYECADTMPSVETVQRGLLLAKRQGCDLLVSLGGDNAHDCAKGISLCATNGGRIDAYEGVDVSLRAGMALVCINVSGGSGSHVSHFCLIARPHRSVHLAVVDRNLAPAISISDPTLMLALSPEVTAESGMNTLSHAVEAYLSTSATPLTDACALKAIELLGDNLAHAVSRGRDPAARENLAYAQVLTGMAQNNACLGYANAVARQLTSLHGVPMGLGSGLVLPHLQRFNAVLGPDRLLDIAQALRVPVHGKSPDEAALMACRAMAQLGRIIGLPLGLGELGITHRDVPMLASNALQDACGITSPRYATQKELEEVIRRAL